MSQFWQNNSGRKMTCLASSLLSRGKALEKVVDNDQIMLGVFYQEKCKE